MKLAAEPALSAQHPDILLGDKPSPSEKLFKQARVKLQILRAKLCSLSREPDQVGV